MSKSTEEKSVAELIEEVDLEARKNQESATPDEQQPRCPDCLSKNVSNRVNNYLSTVDDDRPYYCNTCCDRFEEPVFVEGEVVVDHGEGE